jgi:hemoglobin
VAPDRANPISGGTGVPVGEIGSAGSAGSTGSGSDRSGGSNDSGGAGRSQPVKGPGASGTHDSLGPGTAFERWGGKAFFDDLVERFYVGVAADPLLRPLYPEDLTESKAHLALFLMQYWGGPRWYSEQRGHPRLRMRHAPFAIGTAQADAWLRHMSAAVREAGLEPADEVELLDYLAMAARSLINSAV